MTFGGVYVLNIIVVDRWVRTRLLEVSVTGRLIFGQSEGEAERCGWVVTGAHGIITSSHGVNVFITLFDKGFAVVLVMGYVYI